MTHSLPIPSETRQLPAGRGLGNVRGASLLTGLSVSLLLGCSLLRAEPISTESPFLPVAGNASAAQSAPSNFQFTGVTAVASKYMVCIADSARKRSRWIAVGSKSDDIEVLSYNAEANTVLINAQGENRQLILKVAVTPKTAFVAPPPAPTPPPPAPSQAAPAAPPPNPAQLKQPETREEKEREARMFVSDMLEIGMRQRKAYEEAKKKAEQEAAAKQQKQ